MNIRTTIICASLIVFSFLLWVSFSGFTVNTPNDKDLPMEAPAASLELPIRVLDERGNPISASSPLNRPSVRFCGWDQNVDAAIDADGLYEIDICQELNPVKFSVSHPDFVLLDNNQFIAALASCESDGEPEFIVPSFYFKEEGNFFYSSCNLEEVVLRLRPKAEVERDSSEIVAAALSSYEENIEDNGGGDGRGPAGGEVSPYHFVPEMSPQEHDRNKQNLRLWAGEYSRLQTSTLPREFMAPLNAFKRGDFKRVVAFIARIPLEEQLLAARKFQRKRELERLALLAARTWTILGNEERAKRYYELAGEVAPYRVPAVKEFVAYLTFKESNTNYQLAQQVLEQSAIQARFPEDKAVLMQSLGTVSSQLGNFIKAKQAADISLNIRQEMQDAFTGSAIGNAALLNTNREQIIQLQKVKDAPTVEKQREEWKNVMIKNIPKSRQQIINRNLGVVRPGFETNVITAVRSARLPVVESETGQVTSLGQVLTGRTRAPRAGDYNNNASVRGFLSFDLGPIRERGGDIRNATLVLPGASTSGGRVFPDFGTLIFEAVNYGTNLDRRAYSSGAYLQILATREAPPNKINVTQAIREALEKNLPRFQVRLRFTRATDADNSGEVYWVPWRGEEDAPRVEVMW